MSTPSSVSSKTVYVTQHGLPLSFKLGWPFHPSTSGADFHTLHTVITLENSDGLRALVAVNLSATLREVLRHYDFKRQQWVFGKATDEDIQRLIERKVYWQTRLVGGDVGLGDPTEALYVQTTPDRFAEIAAGLAKQGLFTMAQTYATALPALMDQNVRFEAEMASALGELEQKHAFERG